MDRIEGPRTNICFLINQLAPGGAPTLLLDIVTHTDASANVDYTVCFIEGDESLVSDFEAAGVRVVNFSAAFKFDPRALLRMARFFHREEFDVLHAHLPYAQTLGRISGRFSGGKSIVSTQHSAPNNYHPISRILERITRPLDSRTIAVSEAIERMFTGNARQYSFGQNEQWCTIYNGVDIDGFKSKVEQADTSVARSQWDIGSGPLFLNVGRYISAKSQLDLIEAMNYVVHEVPNAHLLIVGWGELEDELRNAIHEQGLEENISITGRQHPIHAYYRLADCFVLSSIRESFGIVLVEAMAAGLPVVATDVQGIPEVVQDGETGLLVPPRSPRRLADAMLQLQDGERRDRLGKAGYERAEAEFDIDRTVAQYLNLYRELR